MTGTATVAETVRPAALRAHPRFLRVWAGQASGAVGDQLLPVALSLYALQQGATVAGVGLIMSGRAAALVLCLLFGGALADRVSRTRLLLAADVARACLLVAAAVALPHVRLGQLPLLTALLGGAEALSRPSYRSLVAVLLPDGLLERGNALVAGAQRSAALLGALLGATAVAALGIRLTLLVAAGVYALGALTVMRVPDTASRPRRATMLADAAGGVRAVMDRPWIAAVMITVSLHLFAGSATALTLLPVIAHRQMGGGFAYGACIAAMAAGALPAVALAGRWHPASPGTVAMAGLTAYALVPWSLTIPVLPVVMAGFAVGGFVVEGYMVYWLSALQRAVPAEALGKVMALDQVSAFALLPAGYALVGPAVTAFGQTTTLLAGGMVVALSSLLCVIVPGVRVFATPSPGDTHTDGAPAKTRAPGENGGPG